MVVRLTRQGAFVRLAGMPRLLIGRRFRRPLPARAALSFAVLFAVGPTTFAAAAVAPGNAAAAAAAVLPGGAQLSSRAVADRGPRAYAIVGGTVHLGDGTVHENATVVLEDGLITAVGADAAAPAGAWEIAASGKRVYPGFITAFGDLGLGGGSGSRGRASGGPGGSGPPGGPAGNPAPARGPEDRPATFSWRRAADSLVSSDERIAALRARGFTSAVSFPRNGIVSGHGAFLNLAASESGDARGLVLSEEAALLLRLETASFRSFPGSMMGVIAYIRQLFLDAAHYGETRALYEADPAGLPRPRYDRTLGPLAAAVAGEQPVLFPANLDKEIRRMAHLAEELGLRPVLYGGHEAAEAASFLRERGIPILVNLAWPEADRDADPEATVPLRELRLRDAAPAGPAALAAAGVRFAFYRSAPAGNRAGNRAGNPGGRGRGGASSDELAAVRKAVERGLDPEAALTALTLAPAEIYGVADRLGTLAPGKIANLVIADGDLFRGEAAISAVFVDGVIHHPSEETDSGRETAAEPGAARGESS